MQQRKMPRYGLPAEHTSLLLLPVIIPSGFAAQADGTEQRLLLPSVEQWSTTILLLQAEQNQAGLILQLCQDNLYPWLTQQPEPGRNIFGLKLGLEVTVKERLILPL